VQLQITLLAGIAVLTSSPFRQPTNRAQHPVFHHQVQRILDEARDNPSAPTPRPALAFARPDQKPAGVGRCFHEVLRERPQHLGVAGREILFILPRAEAERFVGLDRRDGEGGRGGVKDDLLTDLQGLKPRMNPLDITNVDSAESLEKFVGVKSPPTKAELNKPGPDLGYRRANGDRTRGADVDLRQQPVARPPSIALIGARTKIAHEQPRKGPGHNGKNEEEGSLHPLEQHPGRAAKAFDGVPHRSVADSTAARAASLGATKSNSPPLVVDHGNFVAVSTTNRFNSSGRKSGLCDAISVATPPT
jgi:hypothetical protein